MAKAQRGYRCRECGRESAVLVGRCPGCGEWNALEAYARAADRSATAQRGAAPALVSLAAAALPEESRLQTGIPELDLVLGGGIVPGSLVLVGGEPGIGKSTLMLQAAARLAASGHRICYLCGEESPRQVRMRATRLGIGGEGIDLVPSPELLSGLAAAEASGAAVLIIDSIQSVSIEGLDARVGGPAQLSEAGARLVAFAKGTGIATIVTGHVTKSGDVAGPRLLEHLVDAVLYFEHAESGNIRVLRAVKNRFGATDEVGVFEMAGDGLRSVENASASFLEGASSSASGCAVTAVVEGTRPLAVEVQALAVPSHLAVPRRIAAGLEPTRLHLLLAVLARRAGVNASDQDIVVATSGGLRLRDPGSDLAVLAAIASALRDRPLPAGVAFIGEAALSGALRPPPQAARRVAELARLGFERVIAAPGVPGTDTAATVREALALVQGR